MRELSRDGDVRAFTIHCLTPPPPSRYRRFVYGERLHKRTPVVVIVDNC
jgi:hypothetical protein